MKFIESSAFVCIYAIAREWQWRDANESKAKTWSNFQFTTVQYRGRRSVTSLFYLDSFLIWNQLDGAFENDSIRFAHKMGSFVNINQIRRLIQLAPNISMEIWNVEIMVKINSLDHNRNGNTLLPLKLEWAFSIRECWFPALCKLIFPFSSHFRRLLAGTSENAPFPTIVQMLCSNKWLFGSQAEVNYRPSDHVCDYYN